MKRTAIEEKADRKTLSDLDVWFKCWTVTFEQESRIKRLRAGGLDFAKIIVETVKPGADRDAALRYVREAMMTARDCITNELAHNGA